MPTTESGGYGWAALPAIPTLPDAACRDRADLSWFPTREDAPAARLAARACLPCPHLTSCGLYAIGATPPLTGIWGGLTTEQRTLAAESPAPAFYASVMLDERRAQADLECPQCGVLWPTPRSLAIHLGRIHPQAPGAAPPPSASKVKLPRIARDQDAAAAPGTPIGPAS